MKSFETGLIEKIKIGHDLARSIRALGEFKGREELYTRQTPQILETLLQVAIIQSTESSNRIERVVAPIKRIEALVARKTTPKNRSEQEIAGYRDVLATIHANHAHMPFTSRLVLQLHRDLFKYTNSPAGVWKSSDNIIAEKRGDGKQLIRFKPVTAHQTPEYMEHLHDAFKDYWNEEKIDKLFLIAAYVLDFLCVHPFLDGNGRMARLLTLLLLYQAGYEVGRYISLEKLIEKSRESYLSMRKVKGVGEVFCRHFGNKDTRVRRRDLLRTPLDVLKEFRYSVVLGRVGFYLCASSTFK